MDDYEKRLKISLTGNGEQKFYTNSGLLISQGYERIVIGERGPYIEFNENQIIIANLYIPEEQKKRLCENSVYYYWELRTKDSSNVKIYFQRKPVNYADYKINKFYISPFELVNENKETFIDKKK